jgi:hypothetical protein
MLASENAAYSASTEVNPKPARKKSKIYGDGNPIRVGNGSSYMAGAQGIDFASSAAIEEAIPPYKASKYGQLAFRTSRLVDANARGNTSTDKIWCYQEVGKWRRMSPKACRSCLYRANLKLAR